MNEISCFITNSINVLTLLVCVPWLAPSPWAGKEDRRSHIDCICIDPFSSFLPRLRFLCPSNLLMSSVCLWACVCQIIRRILAFLASLRPWWVVGSLSGNGRRSFWYWNCEILLGEIKMSEESSDTTEISYWLAPRGRFSRFKPRNLLDEVPNLPRHLRNRAT